MWYAADTTEIRLAITLVEVIFWLVVDRDYCQSGLKLSTSSPEKPCGSFCIFLRFSDRFYAVERREVTLYGGTSRSLAQSSDARKFKF